MYALLGAVQASKPRPRKFATLAGSSGELTRGNRGLRAADRTRGLARRDAWRRPAFGFGFGITMIGAGSEALARIR
jgi:hypothetical protein